MKGLIQRLLVLRTHRHAGKGSVALGGFLDSLVQTFENCRPGLSDQVVAHGGAEVERFFVDLYEKELSRLADAVNVQAPYLDEQEGEKFQGEADALVRRVLIPGYLRVALAYTPRERNGFYLANPGGHGFERVGWVLGSMLLGAVCVAVPWIPIWAKEWVLVFAVGGFFVPTLRRYLSIRAYENELNELVARADRELGRIDLAYLTSRRATSTRGLGPLATAEIGDPGDAEVEHHENQRGARRRTTEGG